GRRTEPARPAHLPMARLTRPGDRDHRTATYRGGVSEYPAAARTWLPRLLVVNLVVEIGIVLTGGLVRLTGSGLGCPTWPQCTPGSYVPTVEQAEGFHKFIEFGNRTLTGVVGIAALVLLIA